MVKQQFTGADGQRLKLANNSLPLFRCPHCGISLPHLPIANQTNTAGTGGKRVWRTFTCTVCGGVVLTGSAEGPDGDYVSECYPSIPEVDGAVPERARDYLRQARECIGQSAGSVMLSASAVDSMLKAKGLTKESLYNRIDQAASQHLITGDMAKWAHQVRLDANDQRHADDSAPLPTPEDAKRSLDFALALADVLFVLPARVTRGIQQTASTTP